MCCSFPHKYQVTQRLDSTYSQLATESKMTVPLCLFLLHLAALQAAGDLALQHSFSAALDEDKNVNLYWNVKTEEKEIYFTVEAKTTGWIGFGISSGQGKMKGADIVIGWVKDGKTYFKVSKCMLV